MDYREMLKEENQAVRERLELSLERLKEITTETIPSPWEDYFKRTASFCLETAALLASEGELTLEEEQERNHRLYQDILPENYDRSFANPDYSAAVLGKEMGPLLAFLYTELRAEIVYGFERRLVCQTVLNELFLEVYSLFVQAWEEGADCPKEQQVKDALYWYVSDYTDLFLPWRIREGLDPSLSFAADIIMESDLTDLRYLYRFGEYISESELKIAAFLNGLAQETIDKMADTYTEGFRRGFEVMGRDLSVKKTVVVEYELGYERMIRKAVENFRAMGLEPIFCRNAVESLNRRPNARRGYYSSSPNRQYDYDHRYDSALYMGNAFKERKLSVLKVAYESMKELAGVLAGPAVVETFGEEEFTPVNRENALTLNPHQQELALAYANESRQVINQYVPGDETSFTIIAFPRPEIGPQFPEIFSETIEVNTLDYEKYKEIQQRIIEALDRAQTVRVTGRDGNETDMRIRLHTLKDVTKETNFENCVADVNIPLGEVFTSPLLTGTEGLLHVKEVYVEGYRFKNLRMRFEDGKVSEFSCDNFPDDPNQGKELVRQVIMRGHSWLPLGEFAIGTNTRAYAMGRKYQIESCLPILIAEKTGPHFAVGDTCYSFAEDSPMYNPDGREVIARDNEISLLRNEDISKAYFSCHTDITIPYSELGDILAVDENGNSVKILEAGRFVLEGTEELNLPLEETSAGDCAPEDTGNQDGIGEKELLVVSFGTSYHDSRRRTIGAIEQTLKEENGEYSTRRSFTSQMILNVLKTRDGIEIDNVEEALDRAVRNGVRTLVIQPTHLMDGLEYMDLVREAESRRHFFEKMAIGEPLLTSEEDFVRVISAMTGLLGEYDDGETALCLMGHGTEAEANRVYEKLQQMLAERGYEHYYVGTVEAEPDLQAVVEAVKEKHYRRVVLIPLMIVAGDHANNDMAGDEEGSWKKTFRDLGYEVVCLIQGLGELEEIRRIFADHVRDAMKRLEE